MESSRSEGRLKPGWWTLILLVILVGIIVLTMVMFTGGLKSYEAVTLTSDRSGLVMEDGAKVKLRGVQIGQVKSVQGGRDAVSLTLNIDSDQMKYVPANVEARIRATTAFGAKYVDLIYPDDPSSARLSPGAVIRSENVSTEVNTVFQNLTGVLQQIDPAKLNGVLSALAEGLRGKGEILGQAISDGNEVLQQLNPRSETVRRDFQSLKGFSDTYAAAAQNIVTVLDAASTTSTTIVDNAKQLDSLLLNLTGLSNKGIDLLGASKDNLIKGVNLLEPTTRLLYKYNPELTCLFLGAKKTIDSGFVDVTGGTNGKSVILDVALLAGDDPYKYPDNLPVNGAKGGPGGQPGCGSGPDVSQNWPVRNLITNTGYGTGLDNRPNPGIGFPGYANYLPATRGTPEPPSIRNQRGGPAPGPIPYPGAPPYGAQQYAPDGTPLYPGLPPAPPPGAPREAGPPPPGSEPLYVPFPADVQPTPAFPIPVPGVPSP
ncbi:MCE family protein [Mycolicibacterium sp.]|uniref:MCE family protein n=1 Tax=Mycolicibacterium sp. TaxID=2320850 RepID=UPI001A1B3471|nr:MCE family protein [Mycolicibacterium sp.]MBJ7336342.1 MCE family protein [Mycolicibacterium sp.]